MWPEQQNSTRAVIQYLPKPRAATSVATRIATFPLRNSETEEYHCKMIASLPTSMEHISTNALHYHL